MNPENNMNQPPVNGAPQQPIGGAPQQPYMPYQPYPYQPMPQFDISPEETEKRSNYFGKIFLPTLIYALLYTIFLYNNFHSVTMIFFVISTLIYCRYVMKHAAITPKKRTWFYGAVMILLAISTASTGNSKILIMNNLGILLLLLCMLLDNYLDTSKWTFGKYLAAMFTAFGGGISYMGEPFTDASCYKKNGDSKKNSKFLYVLLGLGISIPLLIVVITLLYFADAVFASVLENSFVFDLNPAKIVGICLTFAFAFFAAYSGMKYLGHKKISKECKSLAHFEPLIAITTLIPVSVVYLVFSIIQILGLFLGQLNLPENYTYAQYAREGFFQLLFVCLINVAIVLFVQGFFRENVWLKTLLTIISGCTYIMLASSAFRMWMYVKVYHLTFLRFFVLWTLAMIAVLLTGIVIQIFRKQFSLFRYGVITVSIGYLALSFCHPDYWIASYNLSSSHIEEAAPVDYWYLSTLSTDAAPILKKYDGDWIDAYDNQIQYDIDDSLRGFNLSYYSARQLFPADSKEESLVENSVPQENYYER